MNKKSLIYGLGGLLFSSAFASFLVINSTQAQTQFSQQNTLAQTQQNPPGLKHPLHHPQGCSTATPSGMGMMSQQQADRHFILMMIPHHQGAVDMANLALSKANHQEIKKLAEAIKTNQNREIEQMKAWYKQWYGTEVPASSGRGMMSMYSGGGMMRADLESLKNAPNFDKAFIEQMIPHHKMAVMMAGMVLDSKHPEIRNLAKSIIQNQSTEIEQMQQWYQTWFQ